MKPKVDKELLPMKAHYFLFNAGTAPVVPFMPTFARQLGFSTVIVGTMYTILPIIGMLAKPFFGFIADRYQKHRMLFIVAEIITAVAFFLIMFIPAISQTPPVVQFHCHSGESNVNFCNAQDACIQKKLESYYGDTTLSCQMYCAANTTHWDIVCDHWIKNNATVPECQGNRNSTHLSFGTFLNMSDIIKVDQCLFLNIQHDRGIFNGENITMYCPTNSNFKTQCEMDCHDVFLTEQIADSPVIKNSEALGLSQFWLFFGFLIISWVGMAVVVSIGDAICFAILGERHELYGKQRLCGSIGWGLFAIIAGLLVDKMSHGSMTKDYTIVFYMTLVIIAVDVYASTKLKHTQTHLSPSILKDVGEMFTSLRCVVFFIWCIFIGLGTALVWNFLFWHLEELGTKDCFNSMKTLQGFVMGIQCFGGELPFFFLSGWILKKIGHVNAMSLVLFGFGVRFILYSMLQDPWYVLPIELLNGVTFGLFYATMASYASIVAPAGTEATIQGLVGAIFEGVGVSTGSFIGGMLFDIYGGGHTFAIFGVAAFIAFIVHVCLQKYLQRNASSMAGQNGTVKYLAPNDAMHMLNEQEYSIVS